jgi:hypothetical protein
VEPVQLSPSATHPVGSCMSQPSWEGGNRDFIGPLADEHSEEQRPIWPHRVQEEGQRAAVCRNIGKTKAGHDPGVWLLRSLQDPVSEMDLIFGLCVSMRD